MMALRRIRLYDPGYLQDKDNKFKFDGKNNVIMTKTGLYIYFNKQDQIHREEGPAICDRNDHDLGSWYWKDQYCIDFEEWLSQATISEEQETFLMLKFF